jgi:peroxiredoxin
MNADARNHGLLWRDFGHRPTRIRASRDAGILLWLITFACGVVLACPPPAWTAPEPFEENTPPAEQPAEQPAEPVVLLEGQVTSEIGAGMKDVKVTVRTKTAEGSEGEVIAVTETDRMGDFKVEVEKAFVGDVTVTIEKPPYRTIVREVHVGESEYPEFLGEEFVGTLVLEGRVISALTGRPVENASVHLETNYRDWERTADKEGRFKLEELSPGHGLLTVEAEKFGREQVPVRSVAMAENGKPTEDEPPSDYVFLRADVIADLRHAAADEGKEIPSLILVELKPERIVHLILVDDLGIAIPGVTVEYLDEPRDDFQTAVTDDSGRVVMRKVHFDASALSLRLTHEDHVSSEDFDREIMLPKEQIESSHRIEMRRAGSITGEIIDAVTRAPLGGARVVTGETYSDFSPRAWADYEGKYTIRGVPPGPCVLTVHLGGYAPELYTVDVTIGETATRNVRLKPAATLRGVVKTEAGDPASGVELVAGLWRGYETLGLRAMTDEKGEFVLDNAPHDEFELSAWLGRREPVTLTVKAGDARPVEFVLPTTSALVTVPPLTSLKVGEPAPDVSITSLTGKTIKLADLKGKVVLLDFWATWCAPCLADIPRLVDLHGKYAARQDFVLLSLSLDFDEKALRAFIEKHKMVWDHVYGDAGGAQKAADAFGVRAIPASFVIGPDGKMLALDLSGSRITEEVDKVLTKQGGP